MQAKQQHLHRLILNCDLVYINASVFRENLQQFVMREQKSGSTVIFLMFLICTQQMAWQGYGNMSSSNLTEIWSFINGYIGFHISGSTYDSFNTDLSDRLNTLWAPAWNVFTIKTQAAYDSVCYGYAFNNHWMWFNDYEVGGVVLTFVLWKDYNCIGWKTVGVNGGTSGLTYLASNVELNSNLPFQPTDLWNAAKGYLESVFAANYNDMSIVASQDKDANFYGRICVKDDNYFYYEKDAGIFMPFLRPSDTTVWWGNLLVFQTH